MFDKKKAFEIARQAIEKMIQSSDYDDFSEIQLNEENSFFWIFGSGSEKMFEDGYVPGAFFVTVDKKDGHIWTRLEIENFYRRKKVPEFQAA